MGCCAGEEGKEVITPLERAEIDKIYLEAIAKRKRKHLVSEELSKKIKDAWILKRKRDPLPKRMCCKIAIKSHHDLLKDDPERLTTQFLVEMTGCNCKRVKPQ